MMIKNVYHLLLAALLLCVPASSFAGVRFGPGLGLGFASVPATTDSVSMQLTSYYDLRDRESYVQVTNAFSSPVAIHVQIFQNDIAGCPELNFNDTLTGNDTHVYNLDNLVGNALPVNIDLGDDSNGFVVVTQVAAPISGSSAVDFDEAALIGNFRIVDASGYEYRTNSAGFPDLDQLDFLEDDTNGPPFPELLIFDDEERPQARYTINFNQLGGNSQSDIVGIGIFNAGPGPSSVDNAFASFEAFIVNDFEISTSCDTVEFACGGSFDFIGPSIANVGEDDFLNLGINNVFPSTNGENLVCAGNTLSSGFVDLIGTENFGFPISIDGGFPFFAGFSGLNNGDSTGSMDSWIGNNETVCDFFPDSDCPLNFDGQIDR